MSRLSSTKRSSSRSRRSSGSRESDSSISYWGLNTRMRRTPRATLMYNYVNDFFKVAIESLIFVLCILEQAVIVSQPYAHVGQAQVDQAVQTAGPARLMTMWNHTRRAFATYSMPLRLLP